MLNKIIVPLDGSALAERALPYAVALARPSRGRLILVHLTPPLAAMQQLNAERDAATYLDQTAEALQNSGTVVDHYIDRAHYDEQGAGICAAAAERQAGLIVMSTHGRSGFGRWLYGSVADQILRRADVPVLLIPLTTERDWAAGQPARILVPLDGSGLAELMLGPAAELAQALGARLLLTQVVDVPGQRAARGEPAVRPECEEALAVARRYVGGQAEWLEGKGLPVEQYIDIGVPALAIPTIARIREADLIAMATHGHGGLARFALGSVATGTLHRATVPLLLARREVLEFRAELTSSEVGTAS